MYNLVSKVAAPLASPLVLGILLLAAAVVFWRRRSGRWMAAISLVLLVACSSKLVERALVLWLERGYTDAGTNLPDAQAIVVLGGAIEMPSGVHHASRLIEPSDRLLEAFRLYRAGRAPLVLCSGGNNPLTTSGLTPEASGMAGLLEEWNIPQDAVLIEGRSINTRENALRSYEALAPKGIRRILLVTSAMHMPRAAGAFRKAGFEVIPAAADFHSGWGEPDWISLCVPRAENIVDTNNALHEWLGIGIYRMRGWM